jgi:hypothetical protein
MSVLSIRFLGSIKTNERNGWKKGKTKEEILIEAKIKNFRIADVSKDFLF